MEADERIRRVPVPARLVVLVHDDESGRCLAQEYVHEGHSHGTGADDQVVCFYRLHSGLQIFWSCPGFPLWVSAIESDDRLDGNAGSGIRDRLVDLLEWIKADELVVGKPALLVHFDEFGDEGM